MLAQENDSLREQLHKHALFLRFLRDGERYGDVSPIITGLDNSRLAAGLARRSRSWL